MIEFGEPVYVFPHTFIRCMENMSTISVHLYPMNLLRVYIAGNMVSLLHHQTSLSPFSGLPGKDRAEQAGTYNQIIISHFLSSSYIVSRARFTCASFFARARSCSAIMRTSSS